MEQKIFKKVLIAGMARSGIASAKLLHSQGTELVLYDARADASLVETLSAQDMMGAGYHLALGADPLTLIHDIDAIVLSPGISINASFAKRAKTLGVHIMGELELGYLNCAAPIVAITGTNGKTTTTALTGEIFKAAGYDTRVLGNIGLPITQEARLAKPEGMVVAEVAGFMLESCYTFRPKVAVFLNITEDHLDRFGTMKAYIKAKQKIFENQEESDFAVLNYDDPTVRAMGGKTRAKAVYFSCEQDLEHGMCLYGGAVVYRSESGEEKHIMDIGDIRIPGMHNVSNALAASAAAYLYGVPAETIRQACKTFAGVEHRIEFVREYKGVRYINDSKGTNPDSTIKAIQAMQAPTLLILGGYDKKADFAPLFKAFDHKIKTVIALGETGRQICDTAQATGFKAVERAKDYKQAVGIAADLALPGENVLLSPACASYDMYPNFEVRGTHFKQLVNALGTIGEE